MTATTSIAHVSALATHTALSLWSMGAAFLIVIILFALFFLFAQYVGRAPFVSVLLAFYSAYALYLVFPYLSYLPSDPPIAALLAHVGVYAALSFAFFIILRRFIVSDFLYIGLFGIIILSLLAAGFLLALAYHTFAVTGVYHFTPAIDAFFAPEKYFFWWFISPAVGLFFLAR